MNNLVIIGGTVLGVVCFMLLLSYLTYRKIDVPSIFTKIETFLKGAENITDIAENYSSGKTKRAEDLGKLILAKALEFTKGTEQMYLSSQISSKDRKDTAVKAITDLLESQNIKVDDKLQNVISMSVETACNDDTIKNTNDKIDKLIQGKITPLEELSTKLKNDLNSQVVENTSLKLKIDTLESKLTNFQDAINVVNAIK